MTDGAVDRRCMREALSEAARGLYSTSPNPRVGCILVRDGDVIGRGAHLVAGGPHAEVAALGAAGAAARGATAYVTLEPCSHHGRTPPCCEALIAAGVARVVYAMADPNPRVDGRGAARLRAAGIAVESGVCAAEAAALNAGFVRRMRDGRPLVRVKLATSLDGRAALADGESKWITGTAARADVQRLRALSCAIVTGSGTVLADDPALTVRDPAYALHGRQPRRVILDRRLRMPAGARMLGEPGETRIVCAPARLASAGPLLAAGAVVEAWPADTAGGPLAALLARLAELETNEVLVEAGPTLAAAFLAGGCCDELVVYVAPALLGRDAQPAWALPSPAHLAEATRLELVEAAAIGEDVRLVLRPGGSAAGPVATLE